MTTFVAEERADDPVPVRATESIDRHLGARVRQERLRAGLTQSVLGAAIGVKFQQVQKYESGANRVSASMLLRIAQALRVDIGDLFPPGEAQAPAPSAPSLRHDLADLFDRMSPRQRQLVLEVAREIVGAPREAADGTD